MDASEIEKLANLARLNIDTETINETAKSITEVLALVDQLQAVNTGKIKPLAHPLDATQRLRADEVTEPDRREELQEIAPKTADGLFLVPKVIE